MGNYRLVVLGPGGVGKTSLVNRFIHGSFLEEYVPTLEDLHRPIIKLPNGCTHSVEILDTAGLYQFPAMRHLSIQSGHAFIIVYSMTDLDTTLSALKIAATVRKIKGEDAQIMIVGNKCDLASVESRVEADLVRNSQLVNSKNCFFMETSARCNMNVQATFLRILAEMFQRRPAERSHSVLKFRFRSLLLQRLRGKRSKGDQIKA